MAHKIGICSSTVVLEQVDKHVVLTVHACMANTLHERQSGEVRPKPSVPKACYYVNGRLWLIPLNNTSHVRVK